MCGWVGVSILGVTVNGLYVLFIVVVRVCVHVCLSATHTDPGPSPGRPGGAKGAVQLGDDGRAPQPY